MLLSCLNPECSDTFTLKTLQNQSVSENLGLSHRKSNPKYIKVIHVPCNAVIINFSEYVRVKMFVHQLLF